MRNNKPKNSIYNRAIRQITAYMKNNNLDGGKSIIHSFASIKFNYDIPTNISSKKWLIEISRKGELNDLSHLSDYTPEEKDRRERKKIRRRNNKVNRINEESEQVVVVIDYGELLKHPLW